MKDEFKASLLCLLLGISIIIYLLALSGCRTAIPPMDVKFWAGDSHKSGITRSQDKTTLECSQPEFDQYVCLSYDDVKEIFNTMLKCKNWSSRGMTEKELKKIVRSNPEVIQNVYYRQKGMEPIHP